MEIWGHLILYHGDLSSALWNVYQILGSYSQYASNILLSLVVTTEMSPDIVKYPLEGRGKEEEKSLPR